MIRSPKYHQPTFPDHSDDESQSDLDLDVGELDPFDERAGSTSIQQSRRSHNQGSGWQIPLRTLNSAKRRHESNTLHEEGPRGDNNPLQGLLDGDDESKPSSGPSDTYEDQALLLPQSTADNNGKATHHRGRISRLLSKFRFLSSSSKRYEHRDIVGLTGSNIFASSHKSSANRVVSVGAIQRNRFPTNAISNAKYTPWSFVPVTLYNEFSLFLNMYFLLVALSQIIPQLRIGYLSTYIVPLAFVLTISLGKEAYDDIVRRKRDAEANAETYVTLQFESMTATSRSPEKSKKSHKKLKNEHQQGRAIGEEPNSFPRTEETSSYRKVMKSAKNIKVGDIIQLEKDQRVPADLILLKSLYEQDSDFKNKVSLETTPARASMSGSSSKKLTGQSENDRTAPGVDSDLLNDDSNSNGEAFIRTDQLDGETDWKLRLTCPLTQALNITEFTRLRLVANEPSKDVNEFLGTIDLLAKSKPQKNHDIVEEQSTEDASPKSRMAASDSSPLSVDNTAWANTVIASSCTLFGVVVYTGPETRQALSTSMPRSKIGLLEYEINALTKILCLLTLALSLLLVALEYIDSEEGRAWYVSAMRFLVLFSTIVPISMRVNLDLGKSVYSSFIEKDKGIPGTIVRTSTIPEDLGRIEYLLSDKTGTLTQNDMALKRIHIGTVSFANEAMDEVNGYVRQWIDALDKSTSKDRAPLLTPSTAIANPVASTTRSRREIGTRVFDIVLALALCHNVTPTNDKVGEEIITSFQASSPDEVAIVQWSESVGLQLFHRDRKHITLKSTETGEVVLRARVLNIFPFTSTTKRMGIIVQFQNSRDNQKEDLANSEIWFFQKGADTVMSAIVATNDWLDEETANMAREGLRTLVVGRRKLSSQYYAEFSAKYSEAALSLNGRDTAMADVVGTYLENNIELLGVTGVEDKLQKDVKPSIELLRNAGVKIWMLTGDKVETARCVAVSSKLVARGQHIHVMAKVSRKDLASESLDFLQSKLDSCLLIDGESLALVISEFRDAFINTAIRLPTVIACRCSPTQKAEMAKLIRTRTKKRVCCIGDGGNDVSMIQVADVGVGIVGKEGRQASLAADFSITQFCHLTKLLVWHGRNSYKRSAKLGQFVIHRGLIISVCQTVFSIANRFEPIVLYRDWLMVGYATIYTMYPVFSLVLDRDVDEDLANLYPELYKELTAGRSLSYRTFFVWVFVSVYQGCVIQGLSQLLVGASGEKFQRMVAVSYIALVLNELIMVAAEITTWHPVMIASIVGTALLFFGTVPLLGDYFDLSFIITPGFAWRLCAILAISLVPPYAGKILRRTLKPPSYRKVRGI